MRDGSKVGVLTLDNLADQASELRVSIGCEPPTYEWLARQPVRIRHRHDELVSRNFRRPRR